MSLRSSLNGQRSSDKKVDLQKCPGIFSPYCVISRDHIAGIGIGISADVDSLQVLKIFLATVCIYLLNTACNIRAVV